MVTPEFKKIERYIWRLSPQIQGLVTSTKLGTIQNAIRMAHDLMDQVVRQGAVVKHTEVRTNDVKRKWDGNQGKNFNQYPNKRPDVAKTHSEGTNDKKGYAGTHPFCSKCSSHHPGVCTVVCGKCKKVGHMAKDCRSPAPVVNAIAPGNCYGCGQPGHFKNKCPNKKEVGSTRGRVFVITAEEAR